MLVDTPSEEPAVECASLTTSAEVFSTAVGRDGDAERQSKRPKQKVAMVFGYVGERYSGLQWNHDPTNPTVEQKLLEALNAAGLISDDNMGPAVMQKLGWERASRTDKGVHALKNVISVRIMSPPAAEVTLNGPDEWRVAAKLVNAHLPSDIHVYDFIPVTRSFNGYQMCHGRQYEYFLPTFALMPSDLYREYLPASIAPSHPTQDDLQEDDLQYDLLVDGQGADGQSEGDGNGEPLLRKAKKRRLEAADPETGSERLMTFRTVPESAMRALSTYRISSAVLDRARQLFSRYVGTHSFHNFTPKGKATDTSCMRFIKSVTVDNPVVVKPGADALLAAGYVMPESYRPHGLEWVRIVLEGQSFMLNQIRKMIGAVCSIMVSGLPDAYLDELLSKAVQRGIPMAPANGLFLSHLDFTMYNLRLDRIQTEGNNGAGKQGVHLESVSQEETSELRRKIVDVIARREMRENTTGRWMRSERHVIRLAWGVEIQ